MHKGFKCYPAAGRLYISRDVVFDETVFLFSFLRQNAGACPREEIALLPLSLLSPNASLGMLFCLINIHLHLYLRVWPFG